jgi:5-formyltetrahydrofolate cyclo-ligase
MRRLASLDPGDPAAVLAPLSRWLDEHPELRNIALYSAIAGEVDLSGLPARLPARHWHFPKVTGGGLTMHRVPDPVSDLAPGTLGILEPSPVLPAVGLAEIDVFLCPGLAFDTRGGRLGRGLGLYDRMLAGARPDALLIGICHPRQIVPDTHAEAHDVPMHLLASADGLLACRPR